MVASRSKIEKPSLASTTALRPGNSFIPRTS
jgi:hypothetical protein